MSIKHILVALTGETDSTNVPSGAFNLAQRLAAHVTGVDTVRDEPMYPDTSFAGVASAYHIELAKTYDIVKKQMRDTARETFEKARTHRGIALADKPTGEQGATASWLDSASIAGDPITTAGRLADLIVLEQSEKRGTVAHFNAIESAIFAARRPALLLPTDHSELGSRAAIAWNGSPEAADAVERALPLMVGSKEVDIIQVGEIKPEGASVDNLVNYLGWHGFVSRIHDVADKPKSTAKLILQQAEHVDADFLIMGAYSRSPLREMIFGGVTQHVIKSAAMPVLLAH
jgi:nucleotide-binding universal stress UspA family protein